MAKKLVHGVGINDSSTPIFKEVKINGQRKVVWRCPIYVLWVNMLARVYCEQELQKRPRYRDCYVCEEWLTFSNFRSWVLSQDWEKKVLDKDLKKPGNKEYGPDSCLFISQPLNNFLNENPNRRGDYPLGVSKKRDSDRLYVSGGSGVANKNAYIGRCALPMEGHMMWLKWKIGKLDSIIKEAEDSVKDYLVKFKEILEYPLENELEYKGRDFIKVGENYESCRK